MYLNEKNVPCIEPADQCTKCTHNKNVNCPLIQALGIGYVFLDRDNPFLVSGCKLFNEKKIKAIKEEEPKNNVVKFNKKEC